MLAIDLPLFGNVVLCAILVSAAYTFAVSLAGRARAAGAAAALRAPACTRPPR